VALDILYKLITEDEVVVVKMNPVNDYLGPLLRRAFKPFVDKGFLEFAYGGAGAVSVGWCLGRLVWRRGWLCARCRGCLWC